MTMRALSAGGFLGGNDRCCRRHLEGQRGEWTSNRKRETLGGDTAKEKAQALPLEQARGTGPMLGGQGLISQRMEMGVMAKQPETSYCWGPISQWKMGRGTP